MSLAVLIPAYNAARTLGEVLSRIQGLSVEDRIIVVDDGSSDATAAIAQQDSRVHLVRHAQNVGYGHASTTLYDEALRLGATAMVNVHADGAHFPEEIPLVMGPILRGEADIVVGSRTLGILSTLRPVLGSRTLGACLHGPMPVGRFIPNLLLTAYQNWCYGTSFHSFHDGFRACTRQVLERVPYRACTAWYQFDTQFLLAAHEAGMRIREVGVGTHYMSRPSSSTPPIRYGLRVVGHASRYAIERRVPHAWRRVTSRESTPPQAGLATPSLDPTLDEQAETATSLDRRS